MRRRKRQYARETEEIQKERIPTTRYDPDYREGLTENQVQEHRLHGWTNVAVDPPAKTTKEIIHENVFTYFNLIFIVLGILLCLVFPESDLPSGCYFKYINWNRTGSTGKKCTGKDEYAQCAPCQGGERWKDIPG